MQKLPIPTITFENSFDECVQGVGNADKRKKYTDEIGSCADLEAFYAGSATHESLFQLPRIDAKRGEDPKVHGTLTKSELTKLYTDYLVPKTKPARRLYEQLMVSTYNKCPFCGGIGQVQTLDHYLPKANFPLYSVSPGNLVPCCRDCNTGKSNAFPETQEGQPLHPYFDQDKYFAEQWVFAKVEKTNPPSVSFYVDAPTAWTPCEKKRVETHFAEYDLATRFGFEAAVELAEILQMRRVLGALAPDQYSAYLLERSHSMRTPTNNWRKVLYSGLAQDAWFCSQPPVAVGD